MLYGERASVGGDLVAEPIAHDCANRHQARVSDGVVGRRSIRPAGNDPRVVQDTQMFRDVCLAGVDQLHDFADIQFAVIEKKADDREPRRVTEYAEAIRDMFEQLDWEVSWHEQHYTTIK